MNSMVLFNERNKIFKMKRTELCLKSVIREQKTVKIIAILFQSFLKEWKGGSVSTTKGLVLFQSL